MHSQQQEDGSLSYLAEFNDIVLEEEYIRSDFKQFIWQIKYILTLSSLISILLIIMDFYKLKNILILSVIVSISILYIVISLILIKKISIIKNVNKYYLLISIYQYFICFAFLFNIWLFGITPNILSDDFLLFTVILLISLSPNRWIYSLIISIAVSLTYIIYFPKEAYELDKVKYLANLLLVAFIIILIFSYRYKKNITQRKHYIANKKLLNLAATDPLTGISNRSKFDEMLSYWIDKANKYNIPITLAMFDFDDFKKINDEQGHIAGDEVILKTVRLISEGIRKRDLLARWGGEEFMILFPDTKIEDSIQIVERLRNVIDDYVFDNDIHITVSFGIAQLWPGEGFREYIERTDRLLYEAKACGKNCLKY